MQDAGDKVQ